MGLWWVGSASDTLNIRFRTGEHDTKAVQVRLGLSEGEIFSSICLYRQTLRFSNNAWHRETDIEPCRVV